MTTNWTPRFGDMVRNPSKESPIGVIVAVNCMGRPGLVMVKYKGWGGEVLESQGCLEPAPNPTITALIDAQAQLERYKVALSRFASFYHWLKSCEEYGAFEEPLTDSTIITTFHCGGGSDSLYISDFKEACEALAVAAQQ